VSNVANIKGDNHDIPETHIGLHLELSGQIQVLQSALEGSGHHTPSRSLCLQQELASMTSLGTLNRTADNMHKLSFASNFKGTLQQLLCIDMSSSSRVKVLPDAGLPFEYKSSSLLSALQCHSHA